MHLQTIRSFHKFIIAACLALSAGAASAQAYPARPVKIIMPYAPGGEMDRLSRLFADKFKDKWGQTFIVENRGGAGGNIGAEMAFNAPGDGYTLLFGATAQVVTNKLLYAKLNYDPDAFTPISLISSSSSVLVAHPSAGIDNMPQLIAKAKAQPDVVTYATGGVGTSTHLSTELFSHAAGIKMRHVPYKSSSVALPDVVSGQVNIGLFAPSLVLPHVKSGRLKLIAVGSLKRSPIFPGAPSIAETLPNTAAATWYSLVAPPNTPATIVTALHGATLEVLALPDVIKVFNDLNIDIIGSTPAEMATFVRAERARWSAMIRSTGIKAE